MQSGVYYYGVNRRNVAGKDKTTEGRLSKNKHAGPMTTSKSCGGLRKTF